MRWGAEPFERKGRAREPNDKEILLAQHVPADFEEVATRATGNRINVNASPQFATRDLLVRINRVRDWRKGCLWTGGPKNTFMTGETIIVSGGYIYA